MASALQGNEKKLALKVSVHCEGCKKKLKKILQKVQGVDSVEVDENQNRVTVTGNVDSQTLIEKLHKYGKHAEIWPVKSPSSSKSDDDAKKTNEKIESETEKLDESPQIPPAITVSDEASSPSKPEKNSSETTTAINDSEKKVKEVPESWGDEHETVNLPPDSPFPQPIYTTVSYKEVQPSTSYAYYEPSPPTVSSTYSYDIYPPMATEYPSEYYYPSESYFRSMEKPSQTAESYDMFNDENPNACKLM